MLTFVIVLLRTYFFNVVAQESQSDLVRVTPFACNCVCELWVMFVHLMDHLSTTTEIEVRGGYTQIHVYSKRKQKFSHAASVVAIEH